MPVEDRVHLVMMNSDFALQLSVVHNLDTELGIPNMEVSYWPAVESCPVR